jgi:hypothetical protein
MSLEIVEYISVPFAERRPGAYPKIGTLIVKVGPQISVCLDVVEGKQGSFFFRVPSIKAGDQWIECFKFVERPDFAKYVKEQIGDIVKNKYLSAHSDARF